MKYATVTEARAKLPDLIATAEPVALTRHGKPVAVLIDVHQYRDLVLSNHLVQNPERLREVYRDHQQFQQGDTASEERRLSEKLERVQLAVRDFEEELEKQREATIAAEAVEG